jgi:DNA-binding response OmpR family regulator
VHCGSVVPAKAVIVGSQGCPGGGIVVVHRILIVEDEPRIAAFIDRGLRKNGYLTTIARDGIEAVEKGTAEQIDLMLLDLGLPGKDGWSVLKELRQQGKVPAVIIIVTARDDVSDLLKSQAFGVSDYITKPFSFNDLLLRVKTRLEN